MRRAAHIDANQPEIVAALRKAGATVQPLAAVGKGCPDLAVGYNGATYLLEVKNPARVAKRGTIRPSDEMHEAWHTAWRGHVATVWSVDDALAAIGVLRHD